VDPIGGHLGGTASFPPSLGPEANFLISFIVMAPSTDGLDGRRHYAGRGARVMVAGGSDSTMNGVASALVEYRGTKALGVCRQHAQSFCQDLKFRLDFGRQCAIFSKAYTADMAQFVP